MRSTSTPADLEKPILALDAGSPLVSAALALGGEIIAERSASAAADSTRLLALVDQLLTSVALRPADLGGVVALRGPGSFTGLRIALATAFAMRQGSAIAATACSSLLALAMQAPAGSVRVLAAVDALRGEWYTQGFALSVAAGGLAPRELSPPAIVAADRLREGDFDAVVGFGLAAVAPHAIDPGPLAGAVARLGSTGALIWDDSLLTHPLYLRAPATTAPRR